MENLFEDEIGTFLDIHPDNSTILEGIARNVITKSKDFDETQKWIYVLAHYDSSKNTTD